MAQMSNSTDSQTGQVVVALGPNPHQPPSIFRSRVLPQSFGDLEILPDRTPWPSCLPTGLGSVFLTPFLGHPNDNHTAVSRTRDAFTLASLDNNIDDS
jgi:hypothetical protein